MALLRRRIPEGEQAVCQQKTERAERTERRERAVTQAYS
jgi:hypothetical protein